MRNKKNTIGIFIIFLLLVVGYAGYIARHIIMGPQLMFTTGNDGILTVTSQVIEITGTAKNTNNLKMNNATILLNKTGGFTERMLLSVGMNVFIFDAEDKFGRRSQEILRVLYTPKDDGVLLLKETIHPEHEILNKLK